MTEDTYETEYSFEFWFDLSTGETGSRSEGMTQQEETRLYEEHLRSLFGGDD